MSQERKEYIESVKWCRRNQQSQQALTIFFATGMGKNFNLSSALGRDSIKICITLTLALLCKFTSGNYSLSSLYKRNFFYHIISLSFRIVLEPLAIWQAEKIKYGPIRVLDNLINSRWLNFWHRTIARKIFALDRNSTLPMTANTARCHLLLFTTDSLTFGYI